MTIVDWLPIAISITAVFVALWQGFLAKQQLDKAERTKDDTEKLLDEIKEKTTKIEMISDETRRDVKEQISKLVDKQDENLKALLNAPKETTQHEMLMSLLPKIMENPDSFTALIEIGQKMSKSE